MDRKLAIIAIIIVLAITAVYFVSVWKKNSNTGSTPVPTITTTNKNTKPTAQPVNEQATQQSSAAADSDVQAIESDINSIDDEVFNGDVLSNSNLGI